MIRAVRGALGSRILLVALSLLVVTSLVDCKKKTAVRSSQSPTPSTGATESPSGLPKEIDPCSLVTKPEAEQVAGTPLDDAKPVRETCTYTGPTSGPTAQVEAYVGPGAKKFFDIDKNDLGHEFRKLEGVGDEAWAEENAFFIRNGEVWVGVRLVRLNEPKENEKPLDELAKKVATRF